jgi:hypothetical protein
MKQTLFSGFIQMAAGLSVGLSCLAGKLLKVEKKTSVLIYLTTQLVLRLVLLVMPVSVLLPNSLECLSAW